MNVVIYARFSSHSQTEQSIEGQLKVCYEYAKNNDYIVVGEYICLLYTSCFPFILSYFKAFCQRYLFDDFFPKDGVQ